MKKYFYHIVFVTVFFLSACEDEFQVDFGETNPLTVIDAWIDNEVGATQTIFITLSQDFYDDNLYEGISADTVYVEDMTDSSQPGYGFVQTSTGVFQWTPPTPQDSFGIVGHEYRLHVALNGFVFEAYSFLNPVPPIDSIKYSFLEETNFQEEGYEAEFFATDLPGFGNTYWIKPYKNGVFFNQPEYFSTSYDGAFSESDNDNILFIPPVRTSINLFEDEDEENGADSPYLVGDSVGVELHGVTEEAFLYINELQTQTDRQGGISELFSVPITNLNNNIETIVGDEEALGFFSTSSVSISGLRLTEELAQEAREEN